MLCMVDRRRILVGKSTVRQQWHTSCVRHGRGNVYTTTHQTAPSYSSSCTISGLGHHQEPFAPPPSLPTISSKNHLHQHLPFLPTRTICTTTFPSYQQEPFAPPASLPTTKNHLHHHLPLLPPPPRTPCTITFPSYHLLSSSKVIRVSNRLIKPWTACEQRRHLKTSTDRYVVLWIHCNPFRHDKSTRSVSTYSQI